MIDWCCNNPCFQLCLHLYFVFARVRSINVTEGNFDGSVSSHPCSSIFSQSQCSMMNFCKTHAGNAIINCDKELSHFSTTANDISMRINILRKLWILDKRLCNLYRLSYLYCIGLKTTSYFYVLWDILHTKLNLLIRAA